MHYANEESDDIIGGSMKTVQHLIENISRNIKSSVRETWHQECTSQKKQTDSGHAIA